MIQHIFEILLLAILILLLYPWIKKIVFYYLRRYRYKKIINEINQLYRDVDPYQIAKNIAHEENSQEFTYGEIDISTFLDLLSLVNPKPHSVLYDLGSGCGRAILAAKLCYPALMTKGIEAVKELHEIAIIKKTLLLKKGYFQNQTSEPEFICNNILSHAFWDADILFINATAFSPMTFELIVGKLLELKPGVKIILTSKTLPKEKFKIRYQGMELMSWGLTSTYIYEKLP